MITDTKKQQSEQDHTIAGASSTTYLLFANGVGDGEQQVRCAAHRVGYQVAAYAVERLQCVPSKGDLHPAAATWEVSWWWRWRCDCLRTCQEFLSNS
jgi:hypothetical protein